MRTPLIVAGAGGHAKVVLEIFEAIGEFDIVGCASLKGEGSVLGYPVIPEERLSELRRTGVAKAFVAIGDNRRRAAVAASLRDLGFEMVNAISPEAVVSRRTRLGCGTAVMPGAVINVDTEIGDGAIINTGATVDHDCSLGNWVHIAPGSNLAGAVTIGEGTMVGLGARVIDGKSVGVWVMVGAGAVVAEDLPSYVTAVGVPARILRVHSIRKESQV